ncbi:MAG TPA: hypothetical protein VEH31_36780 [Streptosporangiaceae bacterium]|nr:hypothetical protein [Streptosporangiaceae bacterium]
MLLERPVTLKPALPGRVPYRDFSFRCYFCPCSSPAASLPARWPPLTCARSPAGPRLSYRRAAELFEISTRHLAHPDATAAELTSLHGWNLHQLRHSMLTHEAESGTNTPTLLARSRHASVRSLERYARPGPEAVARHVAATDPAARRRPPAR